MTFIFKEEISYFNEVTDYFMHKNTVKTFKRGCDQQFIL